MMPPAASGNQTTMHDRISAADLQGMASFVSGKGRNHAGSLNQVVDGMEANGVSIYLTENKCISSASLNPQIQRTPIRTANGGIFGTQQTKWQSGARGQRQNMSGPAFSDRSDSANEIESLLMNGHPARLNPRQNGSSRHNYANGFNYNGSE